MNYSIVVAVSIVQLTLLLAILSLKRFRNYVNLFLAAILILMLLKFIYYFLFFRGFFGQHPLLEYIIRILQPSPPPFLWLYCSAIITGSIIFRKRMLLHAIPVTTGLLFFIPLILKAVSPDLFRGDLLNYNRWYGLIMAEMGGILFIVYSQYIFRSMFRIYSAGTGFLKGLFDFTHQHLTLLKTLSVMMNVYALILIVGGFMAFFSDRGALIFGYLDAGFLIALSYMMVVILVSVPKVIHYKYSRLADSDKLLKYEKSGLGRQEAMEYMREMNGWMETEKPYLDANLSMADFTEKLHLPGHIISEVLNGLMKQNFYDYINNYRIEEFKKLALRSDNVKVTNLNLAFEAGFNSKTTFNTAFKKFTGQTPSEFRSMEAPS